MRQTVQPHFVNFRKRGLLKSRQVLQHPLLMLETHRWICVSHLNRSRHGTCLPRDEKTANNNVNRVLTIAGVYNGNEVATWTEDQQAKHEATLEELRNVDKFGVVEVVGRPQTGEVLSTRCVHKQR